VGHLEDDKASQNIRGEFRVNKGIYETYAYAYSLRNLRKWRKNIGSRINGSSKGRVRREYNERGKCTKKCNTKKSYNIHTVSKSDKNKRSRFRKVKMVKYRKYKNKGRGRKGMYGKYVAYTRGAELSVDTGVHSVQKYSRQKGSQELEPRDDDTNGKGYVCAHTLVYVLICKARYKNVGSTESKRCTSNMRRILSEIIRCSMNTEKAGGSAMEVDPVQFPDLAIGGRRGNNTANVCKSVLQYGKMAAIGNRPYGE
jgi:hypothetical protein